MIARRFLNICLLAAVLSACASLQPEPTRTPFVLSSDRPVTPTVASDTGAGTQDTTQEFSFTSEQIEAVECPFQSRGQIDPECGYLIVPEDPDQPSLGTLRVMFAIYKTRNPEPKPDPVLISFGYPFVSESDFLPYAFEDIFKERDLIIFDPRGMGLSEPSLDCADMTDAFIEALPKGGQTAEEQADLQKKCHDKMVTQDVDLDSFSYAATAEDLRALRTALGYREWNIYAFNVGARLALEQVRLDTEGIRSLTLSNPFPPQADWREQITAVEVMLNQFFQLCVDHEKCNATFPKVGEAFYKLADQLNSKPVVADVSDLQTGRRYKVQVDGDVLINITLGIIDSGSSEYMGYIPRMVYQATAGKLDTLEKLAAQSMGGFDMSQAGLSSLYSCHDGPPPTEEAVLSAVNSLEPALAAFFKHTFEDNLAVCAVWGAPDVYLSPTDYPAISTPTLLITSGQSWQIPRPWVDQVAKMLPSSQVVMLPGGGMWSAFSREYWGCVNPMVSGFVVDPAAEISAQCAAEAPEITWITLP